MYLFYLLSSRSCSASPASRPGIIAILRTLVHHDRNIISCLLQYLVCHPSCQLRPQQTQSTVESALSPVDASRRKLRRPPLFSGLTELITQQSNPLEHRLDLVAPSARHRRKRPRIPNFPKNIAHINLPRSHPIPPSSRGLLSFPPRSPSIRHRLHIRTVKGCAPSHGPFSQPTNPLHRPPTIKLPRAWHSRGNHLRSRARPKRCS